MSGRPDDTDPAKGSWSQGRWVPPPFVPEPHTPEQLALIRRRQRSRAVVTAIILFALVILFYGISIAKMLH